MVRGSRTPKHPVRSLQVRAQPHFCCSPQPEAVARPGRFREAQMPPLCGGGCPLSSVAICSTNHCSSNRLLRTQSLEWFYSNVKSRFKRFGSAKVLKNLYRKHRLESGACFDILGTLLSALWRCWWLGMRGEGWAWRSCSWGTRSS